MPLSATSSRARKDAASTQTAVFRPPQQAPPRRNRARSRIRGAVVRYQSLEASTPYGQVSIPYAAGATAEAEAHPAQAEVEAAAGA